MIRKRKIQFAVAAIAFVVIAWASWTTEDEGTVRLIYAGVSPNHPDRARFAITNGSSTSITYSAGWDRMIDGKPLVLPQDAMLPAGLVASQSSAFFELPAPSGKLWRATASYMRPPSTSLTGRARRKLAVFCYQHSWATLGQWIGLGQEPHWMFGPEMLGNIPMAPETK